MQPTDQHYQSYVQVLREELVPAMGCTEPIAVAYGAAKAREVLGSLPDRVLVEASGNIIKTSKVWWSPTPAASTASKPRRRQALWPAKRSWCWRLSPR